MNIKDKLISFVWQHFLLLVSLYIMTLGVAICVRSGVGSSVISVLPYVFESAGKAFPDIPSLTIGQYTYIMNGILVAAQLIVLRRKFEPVQLFQLAIGTVFGFLIDINMAQTSWLALLLYGRKPRHSLQDAPSLVLALHSKSDAEV